jgi:LuxR family transcriptional regulator, maltose regulon positive regulatory protein
MWINRYVTGDQKRSREPHPPAPDDLPDPPACRVERPRLLDLLDRGTEGRLTLVSAPAGWGKTTLLAAWARARRLVAPILWVTVEPGREREVWAKLAVAMSEGSTGAAPINPLEAVLRRLAGAGPPVTVVLDGVPHVETGDLLAGIERLVDDGGPRLRLVIGCRRDPDLPLYRWRIQDELTHVGPCPLSLTLPETGTLVAAHDVELGEAAVAELHGLVEGWPAAVRLAAVSMQGHPEPESIVPTLAQHDRLLREYVAREVLGPVDDDLRSVLVQISVLDRMTPELLEALTGRGDAHDLLRTLERANLIVAQTGGAMPWYRFHPLLRPLLYDELRQRQPELLPMLHARASVYFEHAAPADAIRHALAARNWDRAATLVEDRWASLLPGSRQRALQAMVPMPPPEAQQNPWLALAFAADRLDAADPRGAAAFLHIAQQAWPDAQPRAVMAAFRIAHAYQNDELTDADAASPDPVGSADRPGDVVRTLTLAALAAGSTRLFDGDIEAAEPLLVRSLELAEQWGMTQTQITALRQLAVLNMVRATLNAAEQYANRTLDLAYRHLIGRSADTFWAELVLAEVCYQQDRIAAAAYHLDRALGAGSLAETTPAGVVAMVRARIGATTGTPRAALTRLAEARRQLTVVAPLPALARSVVLAEAQLRLVCGEVRTAYRLLDEYSLDNPLPAWSAVIRARLYLIEGRSPAAAKVLGPFLERPQPSRLWQIEANLLHAQAVAAMGDRVEAGRSLDRALMIAENEGIRRPFMEMGATAWELLAHYVPDDSGHRNLAERIASDLSIPTTQAVRPASLDEPLTSRELTVLRYLQSMMSTAEIAEVLYLSVNTVKTHLKSIYRKLGTGRRRDAVERARELQLL